MKTALTYEGLLNEIREKYGENQKRVLGIFLARYTISSIRSAINESYGYWHINTGKDLDVYWVGYGEYSPYSVRNKTKITLDYIGNDSRVFFDLEAFVEVKDKLSRALKNPYRDSMRLILTEYDHGKLRLDRAKIIDFKDISVDGRENLRNTFEEIRNLCKEITNIDDISNALLRKGVISHLKGISLSNAIGTAINLIGLV